MSRNRLTFSEWEQVRTAYASGLGLREIARSMGIPAGTVLARAKREGWTRQVREARAIVTGSPATDVSHAAAASMAERGRRHTERVAGIVERTLPHVESMEPVAILDRVEDIDRLDRIARRTYGLDADRAGTTVNVAVCLRLDME